MKKLIICIFGAILITPVTSFAQSFDTIDDCRALRQEINAAVEESAALDALLSANDIKTEEYLEQLYSGVKILSKTGEMFFKAADNHESACKTKLRQANKIEEIRVIYDWYLEPSKRAYQFFRRARETTVKLNRQSDVNSFNDMMTEYDSAIMKLADVCKSDLENTKSAETCDQLSAKLVDILK